MKTRAWTTVVLLTLLPLVARAEDAPAEAGARASLSPTGRWRTFDDATGKEKSVVEIWEKGGKLFGKVVTVLHPKVADPKCDKCEGELKGLPVTGLTMLWDLKPDGDEYTGGRILDPENGKVYKCKVKVVEGGQKLKVRGFIGLSLLGRTQTWTREP